MTMRGGLTVATGAIRPRFVYAEAVNPLWLAEIRRLLTADEPAGLQLSPGAADRRASSATPRAEHAHPLVPQRRTGDAAAG